MTDKEIEKLKDIAINNQYENERTKAIEALYTYGETAKNALLDIGSNGKYSDEREMAINMVKKIQEEEK